MSAKIESPSPAALGGVAGWIAGWLRRARSKTRGKPGPRLALVERVALAPRQSLALVEAEGRRFLVATSAEGGPAFYPLDPDRVEDGLRPARRAAHRPVRVSW